MIAARTACIIALTTLLVASSLAQTTKPAAPTTKLAAPATSPAQSQPASTDPNPPAAGFDSNGSDPRAIELADLTMQAMGGRAAWDKARFLTWKHFGNRRHIWDKKTGNIRFEFGDERSGAMNIIIMNIDSRIGRAWMGGEEIKDATQLGPYLNMGFNAWQNDGNSIFLPYLLKQTGATLKYTGTGKMNDGRDAEVISMTFHAAAVGMVGKKYNICIGADDHLVGQVDYYKDASDASPITVSPWKNWRRFGGIMLSDVRGRQGGKTLTHTDIAVLKEVPVAVFTSPEPVNWAALLQSAANGN